MSASAPSIGVSYQAHVQNLGWLDTVSNGAVTGTTGQSLRLEALRIWLENPSPGMRIGYQAMVQGLGWMEVVFDGAEAGTTGQMRAIEAIRIWLVQPPQGMHML